MFSENISQFIEYLFSIKFQKSIYLFEEKKLEEITNNLFAINKSKKEENFNLYFKFSLVNHNLDYQYSENANLDENTKYRRLFKIDDNFLIFPCKNDKTNVSEKYEFYYGVIKDALEIFKIIFSNLKKESHLFKYFYFISSNIDFCNSKGKTAYSFDSQIKFKTFMKNFKNSFFDYIVMFFQEKSKLNLLLF